MANDTNFMAACAQIAAAKLANDKTLSIEAAVEMAADALRRAVANDARALTAAQVRDSVRPDSLLCFEDNTRHTMLRRYLKRKYKMTPDQYREKWGLPDDYPFVAPAYSRVRAKIAKKHGLGVSK